MLVLTVLLMGAATTGVGLLPGYAQIGIWAPLLLVVLRIVQGLSGGGEWGGAVLMAMEHAPRRRGLASSVPQMGVFGGILLANGVFALVTTMPQDAFLSWGWRVPFLASETLVAVGLWIRLGVAESPVFARERAAEARGGHRIPLFDILRHPKNLIVALMLVVGPFASAAIYGTFADSYAVQLGYSRHVALDTVVVSNTIGLLAQPGFAWLSDRVGRRPVVLAGVLLQAVGIFVMFALINTRDMGLLYLGLGIFSFAHGVTYSPLAAWLGELFATRARYTGASLGYQLAGTIGGGFTPLIAASLLAASGGAPHSLPVSLYMLALFAITATGAFLARETHKVKL
jgi:MFS family permease